MKIGDKWENPKNVYHEIKDEHDLEVYTLIEEIRKEIEQEMSKYVLGKLN